MIQLFVVSVSLRSIIHSYEYRDDDVECMAFPVVSFRLLTEYHSFLCKKDILKVMVNEFPSPYGVSFILIIDVLKNYITLKSYSFRLLTEYHSFLYR